MARALRADRRYEDAIEAYKQVGSPRYQHCAEMAACYAAMEDDHEAAKVKAETLRLNPDFSIEKYIASLPYRNPADREHLRDSLQKAGFPD